MLWIFVAVFVLGTSLNTSAENLAAGVWHSQVNDLQKLQDAYKNEAVKVIEVDVKRGTYDPSATTTTSTTTSTTPNPNPGDSTTTTTTSTEKTDSSSTTTTKKPEKPEYNPPNGWEDKWPVEPEEEVDESPAEPEIVIEPEINYYKVVPEESWFVDASENKDKKPVIPNKIVIDQGTGKSNLLLSDYLDKAIEHNKAHGGKSIKLNFKQQNAVEESVNIIQSKHRAIKFPLWLHANVIEGPNGGKPLDAQQFIDQYNKTSHYTLSLGWTTEKVDDPKGYTEEHTKKMKYAVLQHVQNNTDEGLNFPLRALYVPKSATILKNLYNDLKNIHPKTTYSVYAVKDDKFEAKEVQDFVKLIGVDNVYLSLSDELRKKLDLSNGASGLVQFGLLNLATLAIVTIFRNGFH